MTEQATPSTINVRRLIWRMAVVAAGGLLVWVVLGMLWSYASYRIDHYQWVTAGRPGQDACRSAVVSPNDYDELLRQSRKRGGLGIKEVSPQAIGRATTILQRRLTSAITSQSTPDGQIAAIHATMRAMHADFRSSSFTFGGVGVLAELFQRAMITPYQLHYRFQMTRPSMANWRAEFIDVAIDLSIQPDSRISRVRVSMQPWVWYVLESNLFLLSSAVTNWPACPYPLEAPIEWSIPTSHVSAPPLDAEGLATPQGAGH